MRVEEGRDLGDGPAIQSELLVPGDGGGGAGEEPLKVVPTGLSHGLARCRRGLRVTLRGPAAVALQR